MKLYAYIGNLDMYNKGLNVGEWVELPISKEDLDALLNRIGVGKPDAPAYYIGDITCDGGLNAMNAFGVSISINELNDYARSLSKWDDKLFSAAYDLWKDADKILATEPDEWLLDPTIRTYVDLGAYYAEDVYCLFDGVPSELQIFFNYVAYGKEIASSTEGKFTTFGWVEHRTQE